jgi:hypothetical protein
MANPPTCDASVLVCASREGKLLHRTLACLIDAVDDAAMAGFRCAITVALHDADELTTEMARDRSGTKITVSDLGPVDRIAARNGALHEARGTYIAWLDAGDVCGRTWITKALERAEADGREVVWHPEHFIVLGESFQLLECIDQEDSPREPASFFWTPPYPYTVLAPRSTYARFPFRPNDLLRGHLGGDWFWACETIDAGIPHKIVRETFAVILPDAPPGRINVLPAGMDLRPGPLRPAHLSSSMTKDSFS